MNFRTLLLILAGLIFGFYIFNKSQGDKQTFHNTSRQFEDNSERIKKNDTPDLPKSSKDIPEQSLSNKQKDRKGFEDETTPKNSLQKNKKKKELFNAKTQLRFEVIEEYAVASKDILLGQPINKTLSSGVIDASDDIQLWPNGEVPYAIDAQLNESSKQKVLKALKEFSSKTSIQFLPYSGYEKDLIVFAPSKELCASYVGRIGGAQPILLKPECSPSEIMHEIMHALGFIHEHQRDLRDHYLTIHYPHIQKDKLINFDIFPDNFQRVYKNANEIDLKSLMIYSSKVFVIDPELDSMTLKNKTEKIPENYVLSDGDIQKIENLYFRKF